MRSRNGSRKVLRTWPDRRIKVIQMAEYMVVKMSSTIIPDRIPLSVADAGLSQLNPRSRMRPVMRTAANQQNMRGKISRLLRNQYKREPEPAMKVRCMARSERNRYWRALPPVAP